MLIKYIEAAMKHAKFEILEEWIFFRIYKHLELPEVDGYKLQIVENIAA